MITYLEACHCPCCVTTTFGVKNLYSYQVGIFGYTYVNASCDVKGKLLGKRRTQAGIYSRLPTGNPSHVSIMLFEQYNQSEMKPSRRDVHPPPVALTPLSSSAVGTPM